jgi:hypothetical protein
VLQRCVAGDTPCGTPQRAIVASFRRTLCLAENDRLPKGDEDGNVLHGGPKVSYWCCKRRLYYAYRAALVDFTVGTHIRRSGATEFLRDLP